MSMFDYAELDFELPNGKKLDLRSREIQCSIECMMCRYTIKNYGNMGYTKHLPFNPFSLLRNRLLVLSIAECYSLDIRLRFNRLGVLHRLEVWKFDEILRKQMIDPTQVVDWPADQIKEYNKKALKEILTFMPSRFEEGTPLRTRMWYFAQQYTVNWIRGWWSDLMWERGRDARMAKYREDALKAEEARNAEEKSAEKEG